RCMVYICFFFFFFQAEDGIRDFHVTGVQTCALPISAAAAYSRHLKLGLEELKLVEDAVAAGRDRLVKAENMLRASIDVNKTDVRSEERRVGKKCRSRW